MKRTNGAIRYCRPFSLKRRKQMSVRKWLRVAAFGWKLYRLVSSGPLGKSASRAVQGKGLAIARSGERPLYKVMAGGGAPSAKAGSSCAHLSYDMINF